MLEIAGIIILGILAQWIAWRTRVPAILPLILVGLFFGPISTLFSEDGSKWIEPVFQGDHGLFPGQYLYYFVSLSIGIILFEGGLTLKTSEIKGVQRPIINLVSVGSFITFIGGGIAAHYVMGLSWQIAFLFAGLIIVTGPTVIAPILRNVPLTRNVSTVLKWEGILIDPIGALVAVLVFEFIVSGEGGDFTMQALTTFIKILIVGTSFGLAAAYGLFFMIKRKLIPHYLLNVFSLAMVLGVFVASDMLAHESGLLAVVVMGMVLGNLDAHEIKEILDFKESISVLLISILFILLSANIDIRHLEILLDWRCIALFFIIILILRPLGVFASTLSSNLSNGEKAYISWVGPRGIVAAGIASLFGLKLVDKGIPGAEYITPLVFMVVLGTVLLNATTARLMARVLGVIQERSNGVMIVGINEISRLVGKYLQENNRHVVLIDNNSNNVRMAQSQGLQAFEGNIYQDNFRDNFDFIDIGYLMAMTSSSEVNQFAVTKFRDDFGEEGSFRLISSDELKKGGESIPKEGLFSNANDYINASEVVRDFPEIQTIKLNSTQHFQELIQQFNQDKTHLPVFIKNKNGREGILTEKVRRKGWVLKNKTHAISNSLHHHTSKQEQESSTY